MSRKIVRRTQGSQLAARSGGSCSPSSAIGRSSVSSRGLGDLVDRRRVVLHGALPGWKRNLVAEVDDALGVLGYLAVPRSRGGDAGDRSRCPGGVVPRADVGAHCTAPVASLVRTPPVAPPGLVWSHRRDPREVASSNGVRPRCWARSASVRGPGGPAEASSSRTSQVSYSWRSTTATCTPSTGVSRRACRRGFPRLVRRRVAGTPAAFRGRPGAHRGRGTAAG